MVLIYWMKIPTFFWNERDGRYWWFCRSVFNKVPVNRAYTAVVLFYHSKRTIITLCSYSNYSNYSTLMILIISRCIKGHLNFILPSQKGASPKWLFFKAYISLWCEFVEGLPPPPPKKKKKKKSLQSFHFCLACVASARLYRRHYFRRRRRRQHLRLKFACSLFYGSNSKSVQPSVLKPDSNDPVECLLSFESPCSAFHSGILIYNLLNLVKVLVRVSEKWPYTMYMCAYLTVCIPYVLYNTIVHEVITSGRGVQLWSSLVGILIIYQGLCLWSPSRCRSKIKGQFWYISM